MKYLSIGSCCNEEMVFKYDEKRVIRGKNKTNIDGVVVPLCNLDEEGIRAELRFIENPNGRWSDFELRIDSIKSIIRGDGLIILGHFRNKEVGLRYDDSKFFIDKEEYTRYINIMGDIVYMGKRGCPAVFSATAGMNDRWGHFELYVHPINVKEIVVNE